jgi:hypothetical protein
MSVEAIKPKIVISGRLVRVAKIQSEFYMPLENPSAFVDEVREARIKADIFSFVQPRFESAPKYPYYHEFDSISVLPISTYDHWWTKQINDKTRNMVRRAKKNGADIRLVDFNEELIKGIKEIYDEVQIVQGQKNRHYGKTLETLKNEHSSFVERSQFLGAFFGEKLIGFAKVTFTSDRGVLMNIAGMNCHRDKAPSNALLAKVVEICAERGIPYLQYGVWSKRGLGNFKKHHAFERLDIPRYFVPLTLRGNVALSMKLHRSFKQYIPENLMNFAIELRSKWRSHTVQKQLPT